MAGTTRKGDERSTIQQRGIADARQVFAKHFAAYRWLLSNLPTEKHSDIFVLLSFVIKALQQLGEPPLGHLPSAQWDQLRDELRKAIVGQSTDPLCTALVDVVERHSIAKQWLFDILDGVDSWIRFGAFRTYEQLAQFGCKTGGSAMMALVCILEAERPGFDADAAGTGEAIALTQVLLHTHDELRRHRCLLPMDELHALGISLDETLDEKKKLDFGRFIRSIAARIEQEFFESARVLQYVSFDGQRVLKSLLAWHWELLNRVKQDPLAVLSGRLELTRREAAVLRLKHLLGTEGSGVPFVAAGGHAASADEEPAT